MEREEIIPFIHQDNLYSKMYYVFVSGSFINHSMMADIGMLVYADPAPVVVTWHTVED